MKTIFCAIHGYTHWEKPLIDIINTIEFQRLKHIKQLAAVHHVYPCATHTRFEHSIGVGHLAEQCCNMLLRHQPYLKLNPFILKLAGLCHDLGHGPLSHAFDVFLQKNGDTLHEHEYRSSLILKYIVQKYNIDIEDKVLETACELIYPSNKDLPIYMYQILSNDIDGVDVDKLDYLLRDSKFTGLEYGIDTNRFFEYIRIIDDRICYSYNHMEFTINNIFMIRHQLHAIVYQHSVVRAFEFMYNDYMLIISSSISINDDITIFLQLSDDIFTETFLKLQYTLKKISFKQYTNALHLLQRINSRFIYKCIIEKKLKKCFDIQENTPNFIMDVVKIGYEINPVYNITLYDRDYKKIKFNDSCASKLFPKNSKDYIYRVYDKRIWKFVQ